MGCSQSKSEIIDSGSTTEAEYRAKSSLSTPLSNGVVGNGAIRGGASTSATTKGKHDVTNGTKPAVTSTERRETSPLGAPVSNASTSSSRSVNGNGAKKPAPMPPIHDDNESVGSDGGRANGYSSGASTPADDRSVDSAGKHRRSMTGSNSKSLLHSSSVLGLDKMIEDRKGDGDLKSNVVHIEVPFGKPIEEVYDGVHDGPVLGSGISGLVRLITHKNTGVKYAVKCLDLGLVETEEGLQQLREEIYIMCQLDHPNIVRLEEVYESFSEIYLVQELCLGGELFDRLDEQPDYHYTEAQCARLVKQMLCSVRYIHSKGIIHRDLKLENFLFSSTDTDSELKMIDFGLSKHFKFGEMQHEAVGTPYTVAPEVIRGCYDERCDVWAIGVITFLLLSGDPPFGGCGGPEPLMQVRENILRGQFEFEPEDVWDNVSRQAKDFIKKLLVTDPNRRPTAREVQTSAWLREWANKDRKAKDNVLNPNVVTALVNFKEYSDMRKLLCEVLSFTLLPDQIADLRQEFEKLDTDGSGEISLAGLKQVLISNAGSGSLGALTEEEVEDIFNAMRVRKTETRIHWHEFIAAGLSQCKVDDRNLKLAFDRLDADHKGYITFENVTDLLGNDPSQSEDAMQRMWGDSMKACNSKHARITYEDFLLLMKGQTRQDDLVLGAPTLLVDSKMLGSSARDLGRPVMSLDVVDENQESFISDEEPALSPITSGDDDVIILPSGDVVTKDGLITETKAVSKFSTSMRRSSGGSVGSASKLSSDVYVRRSSSGQARCGSGDLGQFVGLTVRGGSEPITGSQPISSLDDFSESLLFEEDDIDEKISEAADRRMLGLASKSNIANLTPPQTPQRGAVDYITPVSQREKISPVSLGGAPNLPIALTASLDGRPVLIRLRSRSVDEQDSYQHIRTASSGDGNVVLGDQSPLFAPDIRRAVLLPEHSHGESYFDKVIKDETKTALVVNRKLYRAHRQMRLAVMEASKRFEEQQIARTKKMLEMRGGQPCGAGLTMRHGHAPEMSIEQIREVIKKQQKQRQVAVDKANKRGGRGRRTRKKTVSDMAGMLGSVPSEGIVMDASPSDMDDQFNNNDASNIVGVSSVPSNVTQPVEPLRRPTTPGVFRKTVDPFAELTGYRKMVGLTSASGDKSAMSVDGEASTSVEAQLVNDDHSAHAMGNNVSVDVSVRSMRSSASDGNLKQMDMSDTSPQSPSEPVRNSSRIESWPPPPPL